MKNECINYTQVVWEITRLLQDAESLEEALRTSLGEVVKAVGAEAGTIWFYNSKGDKRIYPSFTIGGADLTGMSLAEGEGIAARSSKRARPPSSRTARAMPAGPDALMRAPVLSQRAWSACRSSINMRSSAASR